MSKEPTRNESNKIMEQIFKSSKGKTIDLVVDHELLGVTPEMIDWWWDNIDVTNRYKLWHPEDHKSFEWEVSPKEGHVGAIQRVVENIGIPTTLRIRWEDPSQSPIPIEYNHALVGSTLDHDNKPMTWLLHEYEKIEKISEFEHFLPELYEENKNSD